MRHRRGSAGAMALLAVAIALAAAGAVGTGLAARRQAAGGHLLQVQGREFALGACALPPGAWSSGDWRITVAADRTVSASHPVGTWRIAADGSESWSRP